MRFFHATTTEPSLLAALLTLGGYFLSQLVFAALLPPGLAYTTLDSADQQMVTVLLALSGAASLTLLGSRILWPVTWRQTLCPPDRLWRYAQAVLIGLALPILSALLTSRLAGDTPLAQGLETLSSRASPEWRWTIAIVATTLGPLTEEWLFRGVLLGALLRLLPSGPAILLGALPFAAVHLPDLGFAWAALPGLLLLAMSLSWLHLRAGSLWPAVVAHAIYNGVSISMFFNGA